MRGEDQNQQAMFSYVSPEARVPKDHPLRPIRIMVDNALNDLAPLFREMYSHTGRPSIPPEQLLRASLLQVLYSIRSERMLVEQLDYNLLFRWFVGLSMDDKVWNHSTFSKNRERLMQFEVATAFFQATKGLAERAGLMSKDHFTVDGTLIEAWASMKSFRPKDDQDQDPPAAGGRNPDVDFKGQKRKNDTHQSTTDPDARLLKKGKGKEVETLLHGACPDGEPQRPGGRQPFDSGQRHRRMGCRPGDGRKPAGNEPDHGRCGQGLRCPDLCRWSAGVAGNPACGPERQGNRNRWTNHPP